MPREGPVRHHLPLTQSFMVNINREFVVLNQWLSHVAAEMPDFNTPEADQEFTGDAADKKDQASHRKRLAQLELQQQHRKVFPLLCVCCQFMLGPLRSFASR